MTETHDLRNQWYDEPVKYEKPMTEIMKNQEILNSLNEKIKAAEEALLYLKQSKSGLERVIANSKKSPVEEAYKDWYGGYPSDGIAIDNSWDAFQAGYNAAYKEPEDTVWKSVALRFGEKLSDIGPDGYYEFSPDEWFEWVDHTYEKLADDWLRLFKKEKLKKEKEWTYKVTDEKGETNPYKQYMNSVTTLRQELFDYGFTDSQIEDIILIVNRFLPEPIKETCGMKDWGSAWTIGYNNYRDTLIERLK